MKLIFNITKLSSLLYSRKIQQNSIDMLTQNIPLATGFALKQYIDILPLEEGRNIEDNSTMNESECSDRISAN